MSNSLYTLLCTLRFAQKTAYNKNNCVCVCDGISTKQMILTILVCKKKEGGGWIRSLQPMMTLLVSQWHDPGTLGSRWFSPMVSQSHPRFALNHVAETRDLTPSHVIVCVCVYACGKRKNSHRPPDTISFSTTVCTQAWHNALPTIRTRADIKPC